MKYNRLTARLSQSVAAVLAALAIAALPMLLDRCAELCEAHQETETVASAPSCHHAPPTGTHVGHIPLPCGHDHHPAFVTAANGTTPDGPSFGSPLPVQVARTAPIVNASARHVPAHSPPGSFPDSVAQSRPLRL